MAEADDADDGIAKERTNFGWCVKYDPPLVHSCNPYGQSLPQL